MPTTKKPKSIILRGKEFFPKDITIINKIVEKYYFKGRTYISRKICEKLRWKQPNGWLKDRACREVLRLLHKKKLIHLPRSKKRKRKLNPNKPIKPILLNEMLLRQVENVYFNKIEILQVKGTKDEAIWNKLVYEYHYLSFKTFVGRSLKYLFKYEEKILGAIGFCDPAWQLKQRDKICKSIGIDDKQIRLLGINNGRFLILPWIKIPNLASHLLSKSVKLARRDWEKYYLICPHYIETFVDPERFRGTCYTADNWQLIGKSKGFKKSGSKYSNSQLPKLIFMKLFSKNIIYYKTQDNSHGISLRR
jgi:hypothetical protein